MKTIPFCLVVSTLVVQGCITSPPAYRTNPAFEAKKSTIKTVVIADPKVEIYEVSAGGVREKVDEWSQAGAKNIRAAIESALMNRAGLQITSLAETSLSREARTNFEETFALFDAVNGSIVLHTYGRPEFRFPEKITNFDYSLGTEVSNLAGDADTLLLVYGIDHVSTAGRKAVQASALIVGTALGVFMVPQSGPTALICALVDARSGLILWYTLQNWGNFQDEDNVRNLVQILLADFPLK